MRLVLFNTEAEAIQKINSINTQWKLDYPQDTIFEKYCDVFPYLNKFGVIKDHDKYFTQNEISNAVEYVEPEEEVIVFP